MKRFVRIICLLLAIAIMCAIPVFAEESTAWASSYFIGHETYLYKTSSTKFQVWFDVDALRAMDELGVSAIKVQRSADGENWTTMFTYLPEYYPQMIDVNTGTHGGYVPYTGTVGYYYRARVTFYAKNSSGTGKYTVYTPKLKL